MYKDAKTGALVYSPTDLIRFMESPYASWMNRYYLENPDALKPDEQSAETTLITAAGDKHEKAFLAAQKLKTKVVEITTKDAGAEAETMAAMKAGADMIFQGCLALAPFRGFTDFLVRDKEAPEGTIRYEIWDTKLARKPKPYYLVQLCCYAEMLAALFGERPRKVRVVLGTNEIVEFLTADFYHYYVRLKQAFLEQMANFDPAKPPAPQPTADHGRWSSHADAWLKKTDHLVRVANITVGQIKKLETAGVSTMTKLAAVQGHSVKELPADTLAALVEQAQLQIETECKRAAAKPGEAIPAAYQIQPPQPKRGLALLPPSSPGDVYFDMEGYPLVNLGLEYLFGAVYLKDGKPEFIDWWAHDAQEEKTAFEGFVDWAYARWKADPSMHIYHYAAYEVSSLRRLMGRYGTREDQVDDLLRGNVFVDLYQVVRQGLRVGEESYSIKYVEHLYRPARQGAVATASQSIVEYARWIESGEPRDHKKSPVLEGIRKYNRDDCESIVQMADWLRHEQKKAGIEYVSAPTAKVEVKASTPEQEAKKLEALAAKQAEIAELQRLVQSLDQKAQKETATNKIIHNMCRDLVGFHRREEKPVWWQLFDRAGLTHQELKEDIACIGEAKLVSADGVKVARSLAFEYRFDPNQDVKLSEGKEVIPVENLEAKMEILALNDQGELRLKVGVTALKKLGDKMPALTSFLPSEIVPSESLKKALHDVIGRWEKNGTMPPALTQFLLRQPPAIAGVKPGAPLQNPGEDIVKAAMRLATNMNEATLCLQGPPGTGKTFTAARMIQALLAQGKKVGVTSNSHKAIINLLKGCAECMGAELKGLYVSNDHEDSFFKEVPTVAFVKSVDARAAYQKGIIGGTAWLFTRDEWEQQLDYLFIDEAGQVSVANFAGMSRATKNIVMLGDQMQLEQPVQGSHPGESGSSALGYFLDGYATIPESLGLFLAESRRMHPNICRFISDLAYEGRLESAAETKQQRLLPMAGAQFPLDKQESGVVFDPVVHDGNVQGSDEEAARIKELAERLIGREFINKEGKKEKLSWDNILFVAPYNMQVRKLKEKLPNAKVGSVDKFQGQEAAVVFVSMCSSYGEYGSRGIEFILDQNRMNVAISRAKILAIVVGDPRIALTPAANIDGMRRLNLFCRLVQECQLK